MKSGNEADELERYCSGIIGDVSVTICRSGDDEVW
jgi:hypothetical protein